MPYGPEVPYGPGGPGGPGEPPGPGPERALALAIITVVVCAAAGLVWWLFTRDHGGDAPRAYPSASSSYATTSPAPDPSTDPPSDPPTDPTTDPAAPTTSGPPQGYVRADDPAGFTIDVPAGWERTEKQDGVFYTSPDGRWLVQIFTLEHPEGTPYQSLADTERHLSAKDGYQLIGLDTLGSGDAAELQYAYDHPSLGPRRVIDRAFTGLDGAQYAILVAGPTAGWPQQEEIQRVALDGFCPVDRCVW
ncbi:hypothetical protein ACZ90_66315 [Streptomyces albus subsp. albus]|nr:hypothetical protein ACZ90_66315 [Streptomyces albus subsp. albus]